MGRDGVGREGVEKLGPGGEDHEARQPPDIGEEAGSLFRRLPRLPPRRLQKVEERMPGEGEHVERGERHGERVLAMAGVVLELIAMVVEHVEAFILDLPPFAATGHDLRDVALFDRQRGDQGRLVFHDALGV